MTFDSSWQALHFGFFREVTCNTTIGFTSLVVGETVSDCEQKKEMPSVHHWAVLILQLGFLPVTPGEERLDYCGTTTKPYFSKAGRGSCATHNLDFTAPFFTSQATVEQRCDALHCGYYIWNHVTGYAWFCRVNHYELATTTTTSTDAKTEDNDSSSLSWRVGRRITSIDAPHDQQQQQQQLQNSNPDPNSNTATTTRYWDCAGGSCGCAYLPAHLGGDPYQPSHCHSNALFRAPLANPYGAKFYGTASVSAALMGSDMWLPAGCGTCWKVTGTSNVVPTAKNTTTTTTTLVLKAVSICPNGNELCARGPHFDIAAPGFDVRQFSLTHHCPEREPHEPSSFDSCGEWMMASLDPTANCDCSVFVSPTLRAGCENFWELQWNNPVVSYQQVDCPVELSALSCWEENGGQYPPHNETIPPKCADPFASDG